MKKHRIAIIIICYIIINVCGIIIIKSHSRPSKIYTSETSNYNIESIYIYQSKDKKENLFNNIQIYISSESNSKIATLKGLYINNFKSTETSANFYIRSDDKSKVYEQANQYLIKNKVDFNIISRGVEPELSKNEIPQNGGLICFQEVQKNIKSEISFDIIVLNDKYDQYKSTVKIVINNTTEKSNVLRVDNLKNYAFKKVEE